MLTNKIILIVEDNVYLALDLAMAIEDANGRVAGPVASVADALALLASTKISAAVLDCELIDPDVTPIAMQLIEEGVPFVIHKGGDLPPALAAMTPCDVPVLSKPLKPSVVVQLLHEHIEKNVSAEQIAAPPRLGTAS